MLFDADHVRVETLDGVATLWLAFPGSPANALTPPRLAVVDAALAAVAGNPSIDVLVVRSGLPAGFCGGHDPASLAALDTDAAAARFAVAGQRTFDRLAALGAVTVAFVAGACRGPGLELALACDYRVAVAGPQLWAGFDGPLPACWGGTVRRPRRLWDDVVGPANAEVGLRLRVERLLRRPVKRPTPVRGGFAAERAAFRRAVREGRAVAPASGQ